MRAYEKQGGPVKTDRMGSLVINGVLNFLRGKLPISGSGQGQKGQTGPRIRVHEESVRGKRDQGGSNVKIEAMGSLGLTGINFWQEEIKDLKVNHLQSG